MVEGGSEKLTFNLHYFHRNLSTEYTDHIWLMDSTNVSGATPSKKWKQFTLCIARSTCTRTIATDCVSVTSSLGRKCSKHTFVSTVT